MMNLCREVVPRSEQQQQKKDYRNESFGGRDRMALELH